MAIPSLGIRHILAWPTVTTKVTAANIHDIQHKFISTDQRRKDFVWRLKAIWGRQIEKCYHTEPFR